MRMYVFFTGFFRVWILLLSMKTQFDFEKIKSINKSLQYSVYGYIRQCQSLFPSENSYYNIPQLIDFTILLYCNNYDVFHVNNDKIFNYIHKEHHNAYHLFGIKRIERQFVNEYEWVIETSKSYTGRLAIIDDTNNASAKIKNKKSVYCHKDVVSIGSSSSAFNIGTTIFGSIDDTLHSFIGKGDVITICVNYIKNEISFKSNARNKKIIKQLRNGVDAIKFFAELWHADSTKK
eukprot:454096_1